MSCGTSCVKYLLFIFNFVFTLAGIGLLAAGIVMKYRVSSLSHYLDGKFSAPPVLLIVIGAIIFVIAFYGCCGAMRENTCMLRTFSAFLLILLLAGIAVAIVAFVFKNKVEDIMSKQFEEAVNNYHANSTSAAEVDTIQNALECCGANGPQDYAHQSTIPKTCCINQAGNCTNLSDATQVYQVGCMAQMKSFLNYFGILIGALAVVVSCIMIVGIVFGLCLANSIRRKELGYP